MTYVGNPVGDHHPATEYGVYDTDQHRFVETGLTPDEAGQRAEELNEAAARNQA